MRGSRIAQAADGGQSVAYEITHELDDAAVLAVRDALVAVGVPAVVSA